MSTVPPEATNYTADFHVDDKVRDPYEMYYADKRQKIDLPTMLANEKGCEAQLSPDGRVCFEDELRFETLLSKIPSLLNFLP